jgi:hypothetical protein
VKLSSSLLLLAALIGCDSGPEPELVEAPLHGIPLSVPDSPEQERGLGVAFPVASADTAGRSADTLLVLASADDSAPVIARFIRASTGLYTLEAGEDAVQGAGLSFGYEDVGLPLLDTAGQDNHDTEWWRVHYATSANGGQLEGWVRKDPTRIGALLWVDHLQQQPLYFLESDSISFHESIDGSRVEVRLAPGDTQQPFDYILHSLETQGPWMRAEVVSPSDYCAQPPSPVRDTVWVRYLNPDGKPRVWYYTRGC